jgi:site-specific recombinase XerD
MLNLFRLHKKSCSAERGDRKFRRCQCPIHVEGMCGGKPIRESLKTTNWQAAQTRVSAAEARGDWRAAQDTVEAGEPTTIEAASKRFLDEIEHGRRLNDATLKKYRLMLSDLAHFAGEKGFRYVKELGLVQLREFRDSWSYETPELQTPDGRVVPRRAPLSPRTALKKLERLRSFTRFCLEAEWIEKNWAKMIHGPRRIKEVEKLPFEPIEMHRILEAVPKIDLRVRTAFELETFILVMRYTGLRISDTALLTTDRIKGDELYLYTQKSGTHVYVPLPPFLLNGFPRPL